MRAAERAVLVALAAAVCLLTPARGSTSGGRRIVDEGLLPTGPPQAPPAAARRASVTVDLDGWARDVPPSFVGISHEWVDVDELVEPQALQLLKDLNAYDTGPFSLRIGGGSQDLMRGVPDEKVWDTLRQLNSEMGARFILGVNFFSGNWSVTKAQIDAVRSELPWGAVQAIELGNEPNFYDGKYGKSPNDYLSCCFVNDWNAMAVPLSCPSGPRSCADGQLAGPAWGHVHMAVETLDWFLKVNYRWVSMVTVHWYKDRSDSVSATPSVLLDEPRMQRDVASLTRLVATAGRWGKALRVGEMNTISNNGRRGVSDALAGALWSLDALFEVAAAGATGVNFHWGSGQNVYSAVIRRTKDGKPPIVKPAFYAYLMAQMALSGGVKLLMGATPVPASPTAPVNLKVWPLLGRAPANVLRVVVINKDAAAPALLSVRATRGGYGPAKLVRLTAAGGLWATGGASLGGVSYGWEGIDLGGVPRGEFLNVTSDARGGSAWSVYMPPGTAALLIATPKRG